jgi:hypothetical protein
VGWRGQTIKSSKKCTNVIGMKIEKNKIKVSSEELKKEQENY